MNATSSGLGSGAIVLDPHRVAQHRFRLGPLLLLIEGGGEAQHDAHGHGVRLALQALLPRQEVAVVELRAGHVTLHHLEDGQIALDDDGALMIGPERRPDQLERPLAPPFTRGGDVAHPVP